MASKFPTRTVVLMVLTLISFGWFWWQTQKVRAAPVRLMLQVVDAGAL